MTTKHRTAITAVALFMAAPGTWAEEGTTPGAAAVDAGARTGHGFHSDPAQTPAPGDPAEHGAEPIPTGGRVLAATGNGDDAALEPRDPHAYSGGHRLEQDAPRLADTHKFGSLLADKLEAVRADGETSTAYDLQGWYGGTYNRLVVKAEGEIDDGEFHEARTEVLWSHAVAAFWDAQLGLRHDGGEGPNRAWLAFGVQGLAPYWFEVEATGYIGEEGRTALRLEAEYELLLTRRLILRPAVEAELYGKRDVARGTGSGLAEATAGLRLRYEVRRQFAPYLGAEWARKYGRTADIARAAGDDVTQSRVVAGLWFWF